jgi:chromosome partitioning protein
MIYLLLIVYSAGEQMASRKTSIITIANQKGGVGKTACAVNLASAYAKMGKKILVIDADPQANATSYLSAIEDAEERKKHLFDAIEKESDQLSKFILATKFKNIDCLAADQRLRQINTKYKGELNQFQVLHPILNSNEIQRYDIVFIDTHPSFDVLPQSALTASDYYLIPLFPEGHSLQGLADQIRCCNNVIRYQNPMLTFLGCIISQYDKTNATHRKIEKQFRALAQEGGFKIFSTVIPFSKLVSSAIASEVPIHFYRPGSNIADAYTSLAGEIGPELKGRRKGRRHSLPSYEVLNTAIHSSDEFEVEANII